MDSKCTSAIVIGSGRVGSDLVTRLTNNGVAVTIVERETTDVADEDELAKRVVKGNGADKEVLEAADIDNADIVAAVTGDDQTNLLASELALNRYDIPVIVARCNHPNYRDSFEELGIRIVSPTDACSSRIYDQMSRDQRETEADTDVMDDETPYEPVEREIEIDAPDFDGETITEIEIPSAVAVIAVQKDGRYIQQPSSDTEIGRGDKLEVYGPEMMIRELQEQLNNEEEQAEA